MIYKLKIRKVGNSLGAIFLKDMLKDISVGEGEELFAIQTSQGFLLVPHNPAMKQGWETFERGKEKYEGALREIAQAV